MQPFLDRKLALFPIQRNLVNLVAFWKPYSSKILYVPIANAKQRTHVPGPTEGPRDLPHLLANEAGLCSHVLLYMGFIRVHLKIQYPAMLTRLIFPFIPLLRYPAIPGLVDRSCTFLRTDSASHSSDTSWPNHRHLVPFYSSSSNIASLSSAIFPRSMTWCPLSQLSPSSLFFPR